MDSLLPFSAWRSGSRSGLQPPRRDGDAFSAWLMERQSARLRDLLRETRSARGSRWAMGSRRPPGPPGLCVSGPGESRMAMAMAMQWGSPSPPASAATICVSPESRMAPDSQTQPRRRRRDDGDGDASPGRRRAMRRGRRWGLHWERTRARGWRLAPLRSIRPM
jgi:hypothetical protein